MTTTHITLCAVPAAMWAITEPTDDGRPTVGVFVCDALAIEKRIKKGVNLEDERVRYSLCCARIEALACTRMQYIKSQADFKRLLDLGMFPAYPLGVNYLDVLMRLLAEDHLQARTSGIRLGATFFPPEAVREHAVEFSRLAAEMGLNDDRTVKARISFFLNLALPNRCGVVEVQSAFHLAGQDESARPWELAASARALATAADAGLSILTLVDDTHEPPTQDQDERMRRNLRAQIRRAMAEPNGAVNFSNHRNDIIAQVLHEFVYRPPGATDGPVEIRILYADGSEGAPFPLRCLTSCVEPETADAFTLRAALMSMRHPEMDREVDMAWLRNKEVSKSRTLAETDEFCCAQTFEQFQEAAENLDAFLLHIYQTGFEPAVVGFYRGLVRMLMEIQAGRTKRLRALVVRPYLYRGGGRYEEGSTWC